MLWAFLDKDGDRMEKIDGEDGAHELAWTA